MAETLTVAQEVPESVEPPVQVDEPSEDAPSGASKTPASGPRKISASSDDSGLSNSNKKRKDGSLIKAEEKKTGAVTWSTYCSYAGLVGPCMATFVVVFSVAAQVQSMLISWWLSRWSTNAGGHSVGYYLTVYILMGALACILVLLFRVFAAVGGLHAAKGIHGRMLKALLGAPMEFFDTTLSGRLLNLFTADMKAIDEQLPQQVAAAMSLLFLMVVTVIMVVTILPLALISYGIWCSTSN